MKQSSSSWNLASPAAGLFVLAPQQIGNCVSVAGVMDCKPHSYAASSLKAEHVKCSKGPAAHLRSAQYSPTLNTLLPTVSPQYCFMYSGPYPLTKSKRQPSNPMSFISHFIQSTKLDLSVSLVWSKSAQHSTLSTKNTSVHTLLAAQSRFMQVPSRIVTALQDSL